MDRAYRIGQKKNVYVYRLVTKNSIEEKIIERQAIKLKLDQIVIQSGKSVASNTNLNKTEYEKILLHGASLILKQKQAALEEEEIDIDKIIEEGEKLARDMREQAEQHAGKLKDCFDFSYNEIDYLQFNDKNYREERESLRNT